MTRLDKLHGLHPRLVEAVKRITYSCHELSVGIDPVVIEGVSSTLNHRKRKDGYGYSVNVALAANGELRSGEFLPWALLGEMARSQGLVWEVVGWRHIHLHLESVH